jgi:hypothetical protein
MANIYLLYPLAPRSTPAATPTWRIRGVRRVWECGPVPQVRR